MARRASMTLTVERACGKNEIAKRITDIAE
jgi:hypothetical protein